MRLALVYNPTAGGGQDPGDLVALLTDAGHDVRHASTKDDWERLLQDPGDLVVAAGGDGTVRKVALAAAAHDLPFAALPIGTANNIGKSLGLVADVAELTALWEDPGAERRYDIGEAAGPWGTERFVEAVGGGVVADLIGRGEHIEEDARLLGRETDRALHVLADLLREARPQAWTVSADGVESSGDYLGVEVLNVRFVGPNVPVAPNADPTDGELDLLLLPEQDRESLLDYVDGRLELAAGPLPSLTVRRVTTVELRPPPVPLHVDDRCWPAQPRARIRIGIGATARLRGVPGCQ